MKRVGLSVVLVVALLGASSAAAKSVRVFAVGVKLELRYADSYRNYRDKIFALMDAHHPRRGELVQVDVDDIARHLRPSDSGAPPLALVNFPEDVGLVAGLIGSRGVRARRVTVQQGGSTVAFGALGLAYTPQIQYYSQRFPGLAGVRYLLLAETDTFYRAFYETFRDVARTYGVYVSATTNVAPARRIEASENPELVALLRDPDEAELRNYAYEATRGEVFNSTFLFDPDGNVLVAAPSGETIRSPIDTSGVIYGSFNKVYLTEPEQDVLPLAHGSLEELTVLDTPIGRLGSVISKDAWMVDVNDRYASKNANLLIQPEAFSEWAYAAQPWQPDGYKAGGFAQVQRNPSFLYNVAPSLTGNLYEVTFDGQSSIVGKRHKGMSPSLDGSSAWIGQNPDVGFLAIAPWISVDPGLSTPGLSLVERRQGLAELGAHLLPGTVPACASPTAFGACANGYRESIIYSDLSLPDDANESALPIATEAIPTEFGRSLRVNDEDGVHHRQPRVAASAGKVYVVWQQTIDGQDNVFLAVSTSRGQRFNIRRVSDQAPGAVVERQPALAISDDGQAVFVVWQQLCAGRDDSCARIVSAGFDENGQKFTPDVFVDDGTAAVARWMPAVAVSRAHNPMVAWVDERDRRPDGAPFEHIYFARGRNQGRRFAVNVRVDSGLPVTAASLLDNKWAPSIAERSGRVFVAWTDFRNYNWDIYAARSRGGHQFSANVRVDDAAAFERLHDRPAVVAGGHGMVHAVWADRRNADSDTDIFYAGSTDNGRSFGANRQIDSSLDGFDEDQDTPSNQWFPSMAAAGNTIAVAWQDNRLGNNDVFFTLSRNGGVDFAHDGRVDDSGDSDSNQYRPSVCLDPVDPEGGRAYVVWEDDRDGITNIYLAGRTLP